MGKFIIQKSSTQPKGWVLTDTENKVVITFQDGQFNESQKVTLLEDSTATAEELARIVGAMGEWVTSSRKQVLQQCLRIRDERG